VFGKTLYELLTLEPTARLPYASELPLLVRSACAYATPDGHGLGPRLFEFRKGRPGQHQPTGSCRGVWPFLPEDRNNALVCNGL
jgi:hypothetical protein